MMFYPEAAEARDSCSFLEGDSPISRLVELAKAALLARKPGERVSVNASVAIRTYFRDPKNCAPFPPR